MVLRYLGTTCGWCSREAKEREPYSSVSVARHVHFWFCLIDCAYSIKGVGNLDYSLHRYVDVCGSWEQVRRRFVVGSDGDGKELSPFPSPPNSTLLTSSVCPVDDLWCGRWQLQPRKRNKSTNLETSTGPGQTTFYALVDEFSPQTLPHPSRRHHRHHRHHYCMRTPSISCVLLCHHVTSWVRWRDDDHPQFPPLHRDACRAKNSHEHKTSRTSTECTGFIFSLTKCCKPQQQDEEGDPCERATRC